MSETEKIMAKNAQVRKSKFIVDRVLFIALLCVATSYIMRGSWASPFFESAAIVLGVAWSVRAIHSSRDRIFRLLATLVLVLIGSLLSFYLGAAHGLL
jgi:hypothetical protein